MTVRLGRARLPGISGLLVLAILVFAPAAVAAPPPNDDFAGAHSIAGLPFTVSLDTTDATTAPDDPVCAGNGHTVWYSWTPASDVQVAADTFGSAYDTTLSVYTGERGALSQVACNDDSGGLQSHVSFSATPGTTYYFMVGSFGGGPGGALTLSVATSEPPPPPEGPANDHFTNATEIVDLPYAEVVENSLATMETDEPARGCGNDGIRGTVWYAYTPSASQTVSAWASSVYPAFSAVYTGTSLSGLQELACTAFGPPLRFRAAAGTTYYLQVGSLLGLAAAIEVRVEATPDPVAGFSYSPPDASAFDRVDFVDESWDPAGVGIAEQAWTFGDGTTATGCCPSHRYERDGDYTVRLEVRTSDGRSASTSQTVSIRTHDVAIEKLVVPQSASSGQTRSITVGLTNSRYAEDVQVELLKSTPGGFEHVGTLTQRVPVRAGKRTTSFAFSYTFTSADATAGKVTFKAVATILGARDAAPADNEAVALPTSVNR